MGRTTVPSPPPRTPRYGLVASVGGEAGIRAFMADNPAEGGTVRWEDAGFQFTPDDCTSDTAAFDPSCGVPQDFTASTLPNQVTCDPFGIWDMVKCTTASQNMAELDRRANAKLRTSQSRKIESEFWTGTVSQARGDDNLYLAQDGAVDELSSGTARPLMYALAELQEALSDCADESPGMIHCTVKTASLWVNGQGVFKEGGLLVDAFGNIIVPGAGYDGSSPTGTVDASTDTAWAYATTMANVRLGEVQTLNWTEVQDNINMYVAWRIASVTWDDCCHVGVNVSLCTTTCTP